MAIRAASPLDELGALNVEVFSYKRGVNFSTMPKMNLRLLGNHIFARDGGRRVRGSEIQYDLNKRSILIRIPLKLLRSPDYLFVSAQTLQNDISLDFGSWKMLKVSGG